MPKLNALFAGLRCRCPLCGEGRLFNGFLDVAPSCNVCERDLASAAPGDGPVTLIILIIGALGCLGIVIGEAAYRPPIWLSLLVWLPLIGALSVLTLRPFKGAMIGMQFATQAGEATSKSKG